MSKNTLNLCALRGDTFTKTLAIQDDSGAPQDLTGATVRMHIRESVHADTILAEISTVIGNAVIDGPNGQIVLNLDAATSAALPASCLVYDLEITLASGDVWTPIGGDFRVEADVTR